VLGQGIVAVDLLEDPPPHATAIVGPPEGTRSVTQVHADSPACVVVGMPHRTTIAEVPSFASK